PARAPAAQGHPAAATGGRRPAQLRQPRPPRAGADAGNFAGLPAALSGVPGHTVLAAGPGRSGPRAGQTRQAREEIRRRPRQEIRAAEKTRRLKTGMPGGEVRAFRAVDGERETPMLQAPFSTRRVTA